MKDKLRRNEYQEEEVERCLRLVQSRNPRERSYAAKRLGELKARPDVLMSLIDDPNGFVRSASVEALGRSVELPAPEVVSHLLAAIDDPNNYVCAAVVNSLGLLQAKGAVQQVEECLHDPHPIVVQAAILAMARIEPDRIRDRLVEFIHSEDYLVHLAATRVCGWLIYEPCGDIVLKALQDFMATNDQKDFKLPKLYIEVLSRLQLKAAIPTLIEIAEREVGLRGAAVEALVEMNAEEAAAILSPLLNDPSNRLRRNLIEMMMQTDYKTALPLIRPLLQDNAITVRETALEAVSMWEDRVSADDVRQMAHNDPNPFVRPQAILTLTRLVGQEALPDLVALSRDVNLHVRRAVAKCFADMEHLNPEARKALLRLAGEEATAEFTHQALNVHELRIDEHVFVHDPIEKTTVPPGLHDKTALILKHLETWQESLPELQKDISLEELSEVDQALSTLILHLRNLGL